MLIDSAFQDSPLLLVSKIAPWSAISTLIAASIIDGSRIYRIAAYGWDGDKITETPESGTKIILEAVGFVLVGGIASFLLLLVEVKLLQITSSLTLGVLGTIKEVLQIMLAMVVFKDKVSILNVSGIILTFLGTAGYHKLKNAPLDQSALAAQAYDPVRQADVELEIFLDGLEDVGDGELSDGWDDTLIAE